ncbi:SDR family oxidoreductase [Vibrio sp. 10N.222.51.C8]|uniref:SDR family oxidoreductase n=1 Tax=unclassified Vibrio TaxID=2614977 RepID=UPI000C85B4D2|nr:MULTISPECIES: SDR family oxidoreductase [unclassified Vibrio]PMK26083.1 dehydrogenase [Vibrio sp. 10N.261.54.C3]PMO03712.1 dehydrogenase [Vibrio sp. 10N.222.55.F9]PMO07178.1 dehydrogenase [Vibrio sp. 10N.222.55.C12]PMO15223.1 dehydrogenase [Vibrio sp. 10N.222.54.F10]PMO23017.1 dehydrogenase [Vibrio sp. 10N.222.54.B6]
MTNESTNQEQRTFVIIGGTSGIGKALAMKLRNENNTVHVASRHTGLNISNEKSICEYFESIGVFDHLVATAGSSAPAGKVTDVATADAKTAFDTKFWGSLNVAKHASRYMTPNGSITLTTGMLSRKVVAGTYVKTAINAALESVTKILAKELSPIRVNAVSPGLTMTEAYKNMDDSARTSMYDNAKNNLPAGKVGEPSEVAMGYLFAINNPYVTGSIIDIDGGALLG